MLQRKKPHVQKSIHKMSAQAIGRNWLCSFALKLPAKAAAWFLDAHNVFLFCRLFCDTADLPCLPLICSLFVLGVTHRYILFNLLIGSQLPSFLLHVCIRRDVTCTYNFQATKGWRPACLLPLPVFCHREGIPTCIVSASLHALHGKHGAANRLVCFHTPWTSASSSFSLLLHGLISLAVRSAWPGPHRKRSKTML